ncbi:MAG TPA: methyltransferase [Acidimicrobiales bacterium]|nr:methyltransferase [Acidimicrobiales bacterium]
MDADADAPREQRPSGPRLDATSADGSREVAFGPLTLSFDETCLIPRPWTIEQSRWVAAAADVPSGPILELCAGVGQIGMVAALLTGRSLVQVDRNPRACHWARINADRAGLADRVEIRHGDLDHAVNGGERFAIIVADPPYVPSAEVDGFSDPQPTIDGGADGLDLARRCMELAAGHLALGGLLSLQLRGRAQVASLLENYPGSEREGLRPDGVRSWGPDRAVAHFRAVAQCPSTGWGT